MTPEQLESLRLAVRDAGDFLPDTPEFAADVADLLDEREELAEQLAEGEARGRLLEDALRGYLANHASLAERNRQQWTMPPIECCGCAHCRTTRQLLGPPVAGPAGEGEQGNV